MRNRILKLLAVTGLLLVPLAAVVYAAGGTNTAPNECIVTEVVRPTHLQGYDPGQFVGDFLSFKMKGHQALVTSPQSYRVVAELEYIDVNGNSKKKWITTQTEPHTQMAYDYPENTIPSSGILPFTIPSDAATDAEAEVVLYCYHRDFGSNGIWKEDWTVYRTIYINNVSQP